MTLADIVRIIEGRSGIWRIMPADDVIVTDAEAGGGILTLWLAGPTNSESHSEDYFVELVDPLEDGLIVIWTAVDDYETDYQLWFLVRDDKLAAFAPSP